MKSIYSVRLTNKLDSTASSSTISDIRFWGGAATFTNESCVLTNADGSIFELVVATSPGDGTVTFSQRGLDNSSTKNEVSGNKKDWGVGTLMYITALASDIVDTESDNTFTGRNQFQGSVSFSGTITSSGSATFDYLNVDIDLGIPTFASTAARDAAIPSPTGEEICKVAGDTYSYNSVTTQWEIFDTGTPTPNASTTVAGKGQVGTVTKVDELDDTGSTGAINWIPPSYIPANEKTAVVDDDLVTLYNSENSNHRVKSKLRYIKNPDSLNEIDAYRVGEDVTAGESLFLEQPTTFAEATLIQIVGDATARTRIQTSIIGSGTSSPTAKLSLRKYGTPTQPLTVRIETDNAGNPSGTLADANATTTVAQAGLTTSLADTTITFPGSFTLTAGTLYHIVLCQGTYGSETIDVSNYYGVGYQDESTTTRKSGVYNGSAWVEAGSSVNDDDNLAQASTGSSTGSFGYRISANFGVNVVSVTKNSSCTATRCRIFSDTYELIDTATFSGNTATFGSPISFPGGSYFRIEVDNSGASYTETFSVGQTFPQARTNVTYVGTSRDGVVGTAQSNNIDSITTTQDISGSFFYADSDLFEDELLSLTDARVTYKLPTDYPRIAEETVSQGGMVMCTIFGENTNQTGLTPLSNTYISNTPGETSTVSGDNQYFLGRVDNTTTDIRVSDGSQEKSVLFSYDSSTSSGTVNVSHPLGRIPKNIKFRLANGAQYSEGTWDGLTNKMVFGSTTTGSNDYYSLRTSGDGTNYALGRVTAVTATTFTITWTKFASATGTVYVIADLE